MEPNVEIDAPTHCIAVWIEGDNIMVRLPDRQLLTIQSPIQLMNLLTQRAKPAARLTVGTKAAPVQYDIDMIAAHLNGHTYDIKGKSWDDLAKEAGARIRDREDAKRARLLRQDAKRMAKKEAEDTLAIVGL
jgi:hypothetical protein